MTLVSGGSRERPQSRCICRERDGGPHSLLSTWDGGIIDDMPRPDGHTVGRLSRLVVKDPLLCLWLWETLMFLYRGKARIQHSPLRNPLKAIDLTSLKQEQKLQVEVYDSSAYSTLHMTAARTAQRGDSKSNISSV